MESHQRLQRVTKIDEIIFETEQKGKKKFLIRLGMLEEH